MGGTDLMSLKINNIRLSIDQDINLLREIVSKKLRTRESNIKNLRILKEYN
ncbi:MAG: hypothetical protein PWP27_704 [Clostridiales bacterium]|nr:hypothetical protein [Clostridiales bacterium]